jgi:DNA-binding CsgD family transcriptional regulator
MALRALCAGAKGFIDESARAEEFKEAIRVVDSGSVWASPQTLSKFIERVTIIPHDLRPEDPVVFTEREREVLHLLVSGHSNREIGKALGIEERTVKMHVAKLMRKAGVTNRIALSVHALTHSLLGVGQAQSPPRGSDAGDGWLLKYRGTYFRTGTTLRQVRYGAHLPQNLGEGWRGRRGSPPPTLKVL